MHFNRGVVGAVLAAAAIMAFGAFSASAPANPAFTVFGSCKTSKPFAAAKHCHFRLSHTARATFVFRSNIGTRRLEVCQQIFGLSFHGRQCVKATKPTRYDAIPFALKGPYRNFRVVVTFYTKPVGSGKPYARVARVALSFSS